MYNRDGNEGSTGTLCGIPANADVGDHGVVLQLTDDTYTVIQPFTITVRKDPMRYVYLPLAMRNYEITIGDCNDIDGSIYATQGRRKP
jgi:hypothetical protein